MLENITFFLSTLNTKAFSNLRTKRKIAWKFSDCPHKPRRHTSQWKKFPSRLWEIRDEIYGEKDVYDFRTAIQFMRCVQGTHESRFRTDVATSFLQRTIQLLKCFLFRDHSPVSNTPFSISQKKDHCCFSISTLCSILTFIIPSKARIQGVPRSNALHSTFGS